MENGKDSNVEYSEWRASTDNIALSITSGSKNALARLTWKKWLAMLILGVVLSLTIGFVLGYITRRAVHKIPADQSTTVQSDVPTSQPQMSYSSPYQVYDEKMFLDLSKKLQPDRVKQYIIDYANSGITYHPGSEAVKISAHDLSYNYCHEAGLKLKYKATQRSMMSRAGVESYKFSVTRQASNAVLYEQNQDTNSADTMRVYVAYTHSGQAKGSPVYVNYGRVEDFISTQSDYNGSICFMRFGKLNPYNMIVNADKFGCAGVVFYPDSDDFISISDSAQIIVNAKSIDGDPSTPGIPSINDFSYSLSADEVKSRYFPPAIPVLSASQQMVKAALIDLQESTTPPANWMGTVDKVQYAAGKSSSVLVELQTNNELSQEYSYNSICALRGTSDSDKFIIVGSHHDEAGSGRVNPATGQALYRELLKILANNTDTYKPRRSVIFEMSDASFLNIGHHEWIEQYLNEYSDRVIAYINLAGVLAGGSKPNAAVSPLLQELVTENTNAGIRNVSGMMYYRSYHNMLGVPIIDTVYQDNVSAVSSLPQCCEQPSINKLTTFSENTKSALEYHLKLIMKLASEPIIPYNLQEISHQLETGIVTIEPMISGRINTGLWGSVKDAVNDLKSMINVLSMKIKFVKCQTLRDVKYRRINSAILGCTRSFIIRDGIPMIDPKNSSKVLRNPNNLNGLYGSTSYNDFTSVQFPGLVELLTQGDTTPEVNDMIDRHTTELLAAINQALQYTKRAIIGSDTFNI